MLYFQFTIFLAVLLWRLAVPLVNRSIRLTFTIVGCDSLDLSERAGPVPEI